MAVHWPRYNKFKVARKEDRTYKDILFASKGEMLRYCELELLERAKEISDLMIQPRIKLVVNKVTICTYVGDFLYNEKGQAIVEDFKGVETAIFKFKWKLAQALYPKIVFRLSKRSRY